MAKHLTPILLALAMTVAAFGLPSWLIVYTQTGWTPASQPGLSVWFEADSGVTKSVANVTSWADKTANANTLTPTIGGNTTMNEADATLPGPLGKSMIFGGGAAMKALTSTSLALGTGDFIAAVLVKSSIFNNNVVFGATDYDGGSYTSYWQIQARAGGTWRASMGNAAGGGESVGVEGGSPSINTWYRMILYRKSGVVYIVQNGVQVASQAEAFSANLTNPIGLNVGNDAANAENYLNGNIGIIFIYKGVAATPQILTNIDTYMKDRGGL